MGCRPSRHSLGKVGDSTWEYNRAFMHDVDKKKQKNKKSGRGRGRKNPTYNDFSSTSKTYYNNRECKSSKITVRLSTDGSTLEIETFDVDLQASSSTAEDVCGVNGHGEGHDVSGNVTTVNVHSVEGEGRARLQRCESAPELVGKVTSNTEPVVWKTWTKVHNTEPPDDKFTCVGDIERFLSDDGTNVYDIAGGGFSECIHVDLANRTNVTKQGSDVNNISEDNIATPEVEQICDIFLKKTITGQTMGGYRSITDRPDPLQSGSISKETRSCACLISRDRNTDEYILPNTCPCPNSNISVQNASEQSLTCTMCLMCKSRTFDRGRDSNPARPSSCDALTCLVMFGTPTGGPRNPCCALCRTTVEKNFKHCDHDDIISPQISETARCAKEISGQLAAPSVGGLSYLCEHINQDSIETPLCGTSDALFITSAIDRQTEPHQDTQASSRKQINNWKPCTSCSRNGFHIDTAQLNPVDSAVHARPGSIKLGNCCDSRISHLNESVSMATNDKIIKKTMDGCACRRRMMTGDSTTACGDEHFSPPKHNWTTDDLEDLYYDDCDEFFLDNAVLNTYNFDFLDPSDGEADDDDSDTEGEYESSEKDADTEAVEMQDPFDNIPTVTRAYEGYSAIFDDEGDNSTDDDDSEEVFIDAVESSYV